MRFFHSVVAFSLLLAVVGALAGQQAAAPEAGGIEAALAELPIYFVSNEGVCADEVSHYVPGADKTLYFTPAGFVFQLQGKARGWIVKLEFVGANPDVAPQGEQRQEAVFSYFRGPREDWKTGLPTFARLVYRELWPGIDLVYSGNVNRLKYEFVVAPGADPARIRLRYCGAAEVTVTAAGALRVATAAGSFEDAPPVAWQEIDGRRVEVAMAYALEERAKSGAQEFGFRLGRFDATRPLILDPAILVYCGYIGGSLIDAPAPVNCAIAVDSAGAAYVAGTTQSPELTFPVVVGPDLTHNGSNDAFVAKVHPQGTGLVYCGYLGGSAADLGYAIAVDSAGAAYVVGATQSTEATFPVAVGPDLTHNGSNDAFVAKVNATGTALDYCGYLGGSAADLGYGIAVDGAGAAYVVGATQSTEATFPVAVGPDLTHNGSNDAFVAKVNTAGTALLYCGYLGGSAAESGRGVAVDGAGAAYVAGETQSTEATFPVAVGPDLTHNGGSDAYVAKVNAAGTALVYCGYVGGSAADLGYGSAVDAAGAAYVAGQTQSTEQTFPVLVGPALTYGGGTYDGFVTKVDPQGTGLVYSGFIGGSATDTARAVAVDALGAAYVVGETGSTEQTFPVAVGPGLVHSGSGDVFVAKVHPQGAALVYCGYIGGSSSDYGYGVAVDAAGNAYVTGQTTSTEQTFPVLVGPDLTYNGGAYDAFVARVSLTLLEGGGAPRPGGQVVLMLTASADAGRPYHAASSLGTGPIAIGARRIDLSPDNLLFLSIGGALPQVFANYAGLIGRNGQAQAQIQLPGIPQLVGLRIHSAFVTLNAAAPFGIGSISNPFSFTIVP